MLCCRPRQSGAFIQHVFKAVPPPHHTPTRVVGEETARRLSKARVQAVPSPSEYVGRPQVSLLDLLTPDQRGTGLLSRTRNEKAPFNFALSARAETRVCRGQQRSDPACVSREHSCGLYILEVELIFGGFSNGATYLLGSTGKVMRVGGYLIANWSCQRNNSAHSGFSQRCDDNTWFQCWKG